MSAALHPRLAAWAEGGRMVRTRRGDRVFVRTEGEGPNVVFLHGFPTHGLDWQAQVTALRETHRCTALDFLGCGLSDKPRRAYSVFEQADIVEDAARAAGIETASLVAHDYGDTVAQVLLHRQREGVLPFRIERAVLLNGGVLPREHRPIPIQHAMANRAMGPALSRLVSKRTIRRSFDRIFGDQKIAQDELDALWSGIARQGGAAISWRLLRYMRERPENEALLVRALTDTDVPLTFVWGPDDPISGERVAKAIEALIPGADVRRLPGVGHYPQVEDPGAVNAILRDAL